MISLDNVYCAFVSVKKGYGRLHFDMLQAVPSDVARRSDSVNSFCSVCGS